MQPFKGYHDEREIPNLIAEILNSGNGQKLPENMGTYLLNGKKGDSSHYAESKQHARRYFRMFLRSYVDDWIDSGRDFKSESAFVAKERGIFKQPPHGSVLANTVSLWLRSHPPTVGMLSGMSGSHLMGEQPELYLQFNPPQLNERLPPEAGGPLWAQELAVYWIIRLLGSPTQRRLARCSNLRCGRYFVYQRARTKVNETFCLTCNTSQQRTIDSRRNKKAAMLQVAANKWDKWKKSNRSPNHRQWVVDQVNAECGTAFTTKWVSQNETEILKRVEALRNAES